MSRIAIVVALSVPWLASCASFTGAAEPVLDPAGRIQEVRDVYDEATVYRAFYRADDGCSAGLVWPACRDGLDRRQYRNLVVNLYISASDASYAEFRNRLSQEANASQFGGDLAVLLMNSVAVVSGDSARRALAAGSAFVSGTQASFDRDLLFGRTWTSLLTAMDAGRDSVKADIATRLALSEDDYGLGQALNDVRRLENQATLTAALERVATVVSASAEVERRRLEVAYEVGLLGELADRQALWLDEIEAMDLAGLQELAQLFGAPVKSDRVDQIAELRGWIGQYVQDEAAFEQKKILARPVLLRANLRGRISELTDPQLTKLIAGLGVEGDAGRSDATRDVKVAALHRWIEGAVQNDAAHARVSDAITAAKGSN